MRLCYISKILKIESNSQLFDFGFWRMNSCVISQRYSKLKAIHNTIAVIVATIIVVLYLKDTQNWKQFTTNLQRHPLIIELCYISKILKIESNSQLSLTMEAKNVCCVISQRYSKLKAIHNSRRLKTVRLKVVLYLKDTQNWKQFTT